MEEGGRDCPGLVRSGNMQGNVSARTEMKSYGLGMRQEDTMPLSPDRPGFSDDLLGNTSAMRLLHDQNASTRALN